jgi:hypothetical protein
MTLTYSACRTVYFPTVRLLIRMFNLAQEPTKSTPLLTISSSQIQGVDPIDSNRKSLFLVLENVTSGTMASNDDSSVIKVPQSRSTQELVQDAGKVNLDDEAKPWGQGLVSDFKNTVLSHWVKEMTNFNQKTVDVSLLLFISVIAPTLTFGGCCLWKGHRKPHRSCRGNFGNRLGQRRIQSHRRNAIGTKSLDLKQLRALQISLLYLSSHCLLF